MSDARARVETPAALDGRRARLHGCAGVREREAMTIGAPAEPGDGGLAFGVRSAS